MLRTIKESRLQAVTTWLQLAEQSQADGMANTALGTLLSAFAGSQFFLNVCLATGADGRPRIAFHLTPPTPKAVVARRRRKTAGGPVELKDRTMLPAHATMTLVAELGGLRITTGQPHEGENYQCRLSGRGLSFINLPRMLFGAQPTCEVEERKDMALVDPHYYRDIIPAHFNLAFGRDPRVACASAIRNGRFPEAEPVLQRLYRLADHWHREELTEVRPS